MSNVNVCISCGIEVFVGVDAESGILIGYCDCPEVPEVDVYVPEDMPCCSEVNEVFCDVCGDFGTGPCSCEKNKEVTTEDKEFITVWTEAEVLAGAVSSCVSCRQIGCDGPNENGYCLEIDNPEEDAKFEAYLSKLQEEKRIAAGYGPEPRHEKVWSFSQDVLRVIAIIYSFFGLLYAVGTGKNNNPKLVFAWYAFCAYMIVSYSAVIIWFLC